MPRGAGVLSPLDLFELAVIAFFFAGIFVWRHGLRERISQLSGRTSLSMVVLAAVAIVLRLALLPNHPVPTPNVYDEFSHVLAADTLRHWRLANAPHPLHQFFETFFVLQEPSYASIYPLGQALVLAAGHAFFGVPWAGLLVANGLLAALCYWALCAYIDRRWALLGGFLAIAQFGPLNLWTNSYWGGTVAACSGCLVFGALPRIQAAWMEKRSARKESVILGLGFAMHMLTRQFESLLLALCVLIFLVTVARTSRQAIVRSVAYTLAAITPAIILILCHNHAVTGSWLTLPELVSQRQYGVPTTLTVQLPARAGRSLTREQADDYRAQSLMHGPKRDSLSRFVERLFYRVRFYRFFFLPPLYLAAFAFLFTLHDRLNLFALLSLIVFALGTNLFPYLLVHYLAAMIPLFALVAVAGLERLSALTVRGTCVGREIVSLLIALCFAPFILFYCVHLFEQVLPLGILRYETWDSINHNNGQARSAIARQVQASSGQLLIFVHYGPRHRYQEEWVWNEADIDSARVVWARDLGLEENAKLIRYYPQRKILYFDPDLPDLRLSSQPASE